MYKIFFFFDINLKKIILKNTKHALVVPQQGHEEFLQRRLQMIFTNA